MIIIIMIRPDQTRLDWTGLDSVQSGLVWSGLLDCGPILKKDRKTAVFHTYKKTGPVTRRTDG
jgi:hypothetical protein